MDTLFHFFHHFHYYLFLWDRFVIPPILLLGMVAGICAAFHALLQKRDPRSALGWTAVCLFFPGVGALLYLLFGINRIRARAQDWHAQGRWEISSRLKPTAGHWDWKRHSSTDHLAAFFSLVRVSEAVSGLPLVEGCRIAPLFNGEEAYPPMLRAIANAKRRVFLSTYIFESNELGKKFVEALGEARDRGVDVRVLVDGAGTHYSRPRIQKWLKRRGIPHRLFLPLTLSPRSVHLNLRTHRKLLIIDGELGFTGGMNIGGRHCVEDPKNNNPTQDIHFQVEGPVLAQLQEAFLMDWSFAQGHEPESVEMDLSCSEVPKGKAMARGIIAGPNEDFEKLRWIVNASITCAQRKIRIMTPYFIPDGEMTAALATAALRGVEVEIILPEKNNLPYVKWASQALFEELLHFGIKIYYQPPPFAHSKFMVIDDFFSLIGSANLDPRSLILNFEFNLEVYDWDLAQRLMEHFDRVRLDSKIITATYLQSRPFYKKVRDSLCKLFSPYL